MPDSVKTESKESEQNYGTRIFTYVFGAIALFISSYFILLTIIPIVFFYSQPLKNAIARGDIVAMKRAIAKGADVNAIDIRSGYTMLTLASRYGCHMDELRKKPVLRLQRVREMLQVLIDSGADINVKDSFGYTTVFQVTHSPYFRLPASSDVIEEQKRLLAMLLAKGADFNVKDSDGDTPLHNAIRISVKSDNLKIVEFLIKSGVDINAGNKKGQTPLKLAMLGKDKELIELLLQHGAKE